VTTTTYNILDKAQDMVSVAIRWVTKAQWAVQVTNASACDWLGRAGKSLEMAQTCHQEMLNQQARGMSAADLAYYLGSLEACVKECTYSTIMALDQSCKF